MNPLFDKPFTFDRVARILFGLAVISGIIYLIAVLRNALLPFLIAWLLDLAGGCRDRPLCHPGVQPDFGTDAGT